MLRRRIAKELRRLRTEAGVTPEQVLERIGVARSTLSRIERAEVATSVGNVESLLHLYGVGPEDIAALVELAKAARKRGWWQRFGDVLPDWFQAYIGLEADASHISEYEPALIPGILQTEQYARALIRAEHPNDSDEDVQQRIELRMRRQQRESPPTMWLIIDEAAVVRPVGGDATMQAQLERVLEASRRPGIDVQVLEFGAGEHASMGDSFTILTFADPRDTPVVYLENPVGGLYLEEPEEIDEFTAKFEHLRATAAGPRRSRDILTDAIAGLTRKEARDG